MTTKAYTLNLLINEVSSIPATVGSLANLTSIISPRAGSTSAKVAALENFLNGKLVNVFYGNNGYAKFGKTPRTRLVRALRARKNGKFV